MCISIKEWLRGELRLISPIKKAMFISENLGGITPATLLLLALSLAKNYAGKGAWFYLSTFSRYLQDKPKERDPSTFLL